MLDSINSARWLSEFKNQSLDFLIFPSSPQRRIQPELERLLPSSGEANLHLALVARYFARPLWILEKSANNFFWRSFLKVAIKKFQPSVLHALEL